MGRDEDSYQPGEEAFYHDTGEVDRVKVLENNCDAEWIIYQLEVLGNIKQSSLTKPPKAGDKFELRKKRDSGGFSGLGHLMDY
jgi:hypothetical protein